MVRMMTGGIVDRFLRFVKAEMIQKNETEIRCPCRRCKLSSLMDPDSSTIKGHLLMRGFMDGYLTGINPGKSHGQGPWVRHERHRLDDGSWANRRKGSCSILLLGEMRLQGMPRLVRKARVTDCVVDSLDVSPPGLYILGQVSGR